VCFELIWHINTDPETVPTFAERFLGAQHRRKRSRRYEMRG
jgi:hypothetical protein